MSHPSRYLGTLLAAALLLSGSGAKAEPCLEPGQWYDPRNEAQLKAAEAFELLDDAAFVLLGEQHDRAAHHRWQLHTLAGLHARDSLAAVGFEMLPRGKQAVLDDWRTGQIDHSTFLNDSEWQRVWGYAGKLYRPLLEFVRMQRLPAQALNVERQTVRAIREEGWSALDEQERESVGEPAAPSEAYRERMRETLQEHPGVDRADAETLERFLAAQTFWDRAMAEALVEAYERHGGPVAAIVGRGHIEYSDGIPHQLTDLGYDDTLVLLPVDAARGSCPDPGEADLVFALETAEAEDETPEPPRLGIVMVPGEEETGIVIHRVLEGTPAEAAKLERGDRIVQAAGQRIQQPAEMQRIVARQPPGTWLPLVVERSGEEREIVVRFPAP
ncbi:MAG: ChaN family lipoprotein [Halorhodospira sp.]